MAATLVPPRELANTTDKSCCGASESSMPREQPCQPTLPPGHPTSSCVSTRAPLLEGSSANWGILTPRHALLWHTKIHT